MKPEQEEVQESVDQDKLAEEAAFNAAMAGDEPDVGTPDNNQNAEESAESNDHAESTDQTQPEREEVFPGYTKEELTEALALIPQLKKSIETQNGTYGQKFQEQQRIIQQLQEQRANTTQQPHVEAAKLTADSFKKLKEAGFDELAESLAQDLGGLLPQGNANIDIDAIKNDIFKQVNGRFEEITQRQFDESLSMLNSQHPDWKDVASFSTTSSGLVRWNDSKFGNWVAQQPEETQIEILESSDPRKISGWIGEYKNSLQDDAQGTADTGQSVSTRRNVLKKAVVPRGVTASKQMSEKQIEDDAYRKAMAGED